MVLPVLGPGGAERVVADLASRLPAFGFNVTVCCLEDETERIGCELVEAGISVVGLRRHRRNTLSCARALAAMFARTRPQLVHAHLFHANLAARLALAFLSKGDEKVGIPRLVSTVHVQERRFRPWQFTLDRVTARWCEREICVSPSVESYHRKKTGLPTEFFHIIENGVDLSRFAPCDAPTREKIRERLGLSPARRLVLAVGRLDRQKDHASLLEAWRALDTSDAVLWIAGEGAERIRLEAILPDNARLLGFRSDVPDLLAACDVFVQSSAWEGQPLTVLEAMAKGCAILASDIESHRDVLNDGTTGLLASQGDQPSWTSNLERILGDPLLRTRLGRSASADAFERFSAKRMARDHAALYCEVLGV